jgi:methyl-accepting chemotaxis protein
MTRAQRRQRYISGSFQRRLILQFCTLAALGCVAFGAALYLASMRTLTTAFFHSKLRVMSTADVLLPALGVATLIVTALVAVAATARVLLFSHRIAGPLHRLEKTARTIGDGDLSLQVRLRDGDELQGFARSMDTMVTALRAQVQQIREQTRQLQEILAQAHQRAATPPELLRQLQDTQGRLNDAVSRFRV